MGKNEVICPYDGKDALRFADSVKRPRKIRVDGAYPAEWLEEWGRDLKQIHKIDLESTTYKESQGFQVIPWRWKVKRTWVFRMAILACSHAAFSRPPMKVLVNPKVPSLQSASSASD